MATIQWQSTPEEHTRLDYRRQRSAAETLTPEEHQELLAYVARIEQHDSQRAEALVQFNLNPKLPLK